MKELDDTDKQILRTGYNDHITDIVCTVEKVAQNFQLHNISPTNTDVMISELKSAVQKLEEFKEKILRLETQP